MEEKLAIDGKLIGTTAEHVEYNKQGWPEATNAKTALDDLQERLSGVENSGGDSSSDDEISNADLALLADKMLVAGGIASGWWEYGTIMAGAVAHPNFIDGQLKKISDFPQKDAWRSGTYFRVYKGDTLFYQNCGTEYTYAVIITDLELNVLDAWPQLSKAQWTTGISSNLDGVPITEDGWAFVSKYPNNLCPAVWTTWTDRKTLANKRLKYMAYGDSISIDQAGAYLFGYPKITARILGADLDKIASRGMSLPYLLSNVTNCPADADIVTSHFAANDVGGISDGICCSQPTSGTVASGSISYTVPSAYMAKLIKDGGLVLQGSSVKVTGISINGTSIYANAEGYALSGNSRFNTTANNIDISTLSSGDEIVVTVVDQGSGTLSLGPAKQVGIVADVIAVQDIEASKRELMCTFVGQYRYGIESLISILKKPTAKVFCIGSMSLKASLDAVADAPTPGTTTYRLYKMSLGLKDLIAAMNNPKVVFLDGARLLQNFNNNYISFWADDRTHPNQEGQTILGVNLAVAIADVLGLDRHSGVVASYNAKLPVS